MTCRELTSFIADYLSGDLDASVRKAFERHLSLCDNCVQYLADYELTMALGKGVFALESEDDVPPDVPEDLVVAILASRGN